MTRAPAACPRPRRRASAWSWVRKPSMPWRVATKPRWAMTGRSAARSAAAMIQPKAGAGVHPVPAFRFLAFAPQRRALSPCVAFTDIPSIQLQDHLVRFQRQFQLMLLRGGLLIQLGAQALGAFPLAFGFTV